MEQKPRPWVCTCVLPVHAEDALLLGLPPPPPPRSLHECSFLTEIRQLELSQVADEQVLGLQVPVEDPPAVDVAQSSEQLEQEDLEQQQEASGPRQAVWTIHVSPKSQQTWTLWRCSPPGCWLRYWPRSVCWSSRGEAGQDLNAAQTETRTRRSTKTSSWPPPPLTTYSKTKVRDSLVWMMS